MTILIQSLALNSTLAFIAALAIAMVFAWIVHHLVEMPTQRLGKRLASSLPQIKEQPDMIPAVR
jgi:peptidoglycan/LPS O-acetylase OafA/YrhL